MKNKYNLSTKASRFSTALLLMLVCFYNTSSYAQSSTTASGEFSLQGRLTTNTGTPIADGAHSLIVRVYAEGGGSAVFTETQNITTAGGLFDAMIGGTGDGGSTFTVNANTDYEIGITVDGESELSPRIQLGSAINSLTADLAANANAVGGFGVSTVDSAQANTLLVLNSQGRIRTSLLDSAVVTGINGATGNINIVGGGDLSVTTTGSGITLGFTGSGGGALNFPFTRSLDLATGSAFSISNTLAGSAASFSNTGIGSAVQVSSTVGSAITATSNGSLLGGATLELNNLGGTAINATGNASTGAVVMIRNSSSNASARLISATNASANTVFDVSANGRTVINSTVANALEVSTSDSAAGSAALNVIGGLRLQGPVGTGTILLGQTQATINNVYARANSVILITVNGGGAAAVPLRLASQANGSFVVSVFNGLGAVTGAVTFNYIIINQ
jgi:hypothetical protein